MTEIGAGTNTAAFAAVTLAAIDRTVFAATIVDTFLYDPEKDSDGGAWRKRCSHTSWENETLSGNWLGSAANETAARAISGATTGSYYYDTTALGFYTLNAGSGKTVTYRGNVRQFPAQVLITVEAARVILWDPTQAGCPMWMVFIRGADLQLYSGAITCVAAMNGLIVVGENTTGALSLLNFVADLGYFRLTTTSRYSAGRISQRNTSNPLIEAGVLAAIVDRNINDVAMTVLPNAPVDVATGLAIPTIAVVTLGGVSVVKDDGTVVNSSATTPAGNHATIAGTRLWIDGSNAGAYLQSAELIGISAGFATPPISTPWTQWPNGGSTAPCITSNPRRREKVFKGTNVGVVALVHNEASITKGMLAYITKDYNSGWMPGDIRGAWLADTVAETKTGGTDTDRSVKANNLTVNGSLTKAAVASGAQLVGYSGWSAANYCEQAYSANLDFGTGDFCIMGWIKEVPNAANEVIVCRSAYAGSFSGSFIRMIVTSSGALTAQISDDGTATVDSITSSSVIDDSVWRLCWLIRRGGYFELWINDAKAASDIAVANAAGSLSNAAATLRVGYQQDGTQPLSNGFLALWRAGATAPSAEQIKHIYETEKALFEANAQCCLAGTSNAVTALAYDEETDLLHVGTSYGRSAFKGLVRVSSEATPVGAITALAASAGVVVQGGASGADVYVPAYTLREELLRDAEQMAKFGQNLVPHDFTATASQTTFTLPVGWEIVAVYQQGALKRETTSWSKSFDGFKWSAVLVTGATVSDWISILAKRVN